MIETIVTPVVAWRLFHMPKDGSVLKSLYEKKTDWQPRSKQTAVCAKDKKIPTLRITSDPPYSVKTETVHEETPHSRCTCGIWGFKSVENLVAADAIETGIVEVMQVNWSLYHDPNFEMVLGEVYLWGRVMEHSLGFRGEFACVKRLHRIFKYQEGPVRPYLTANNRYHLSAITAVEPEIDIKWRHEEGIWQISETSSERLEASLSGLLSQSLYQRNQLEQSGLCQNESLLWSPSRYQVFYHTRNWFPGQVVPYTAAASVQLATKPVIGLSNRSIPKGSEQAVAHKQDVAKDKFWKQLSGGRRSLLP